MKRSIMSVLLFLSIVGSAFAFDLADPVNQVDIPSNMRYQSYATLSGYTSITINFKGDLGRPAYLGYVRNIGSQNIELMPNYYIDTGNTMNPIIIGGSGVVWNFSPNNLQVDTLKIRSTTTTELNIEVVIH